MKCIQKSAIALTFLVVFTFTGVVLAQSGTYPGMTGPALDLSKVGFDKLGPTATTCGKYFVYVPTSQPEKAGEILAVFTPQDNGVANTVILPWGEDKFQVRVADVYRTPAILIIRVGGPVFPWGEIQLNEVDYASAPCLSRLKKATGPVVSRAAN